MMFIAVQNMYNTFRNLTIIRNVENVTQILNVLTLKILAMFILVQLKMFLYNLWGMSTEH
jgi:hypothetical protein